MKSILNDELMKSFLDSKALPASTLKAYKNDIQIFMRYNDLNSYNSISFNLKRYFQESEDKVRTKKRRYVSLNNYFSYLFKNGYSELHLLKSLDIKIFLKQPFRFESLSKEKLEKFQEYLNSNQKAKQYNIIFNLALDTGLSIHSILNLSKENFMFIYNRETTIELVLDDNTYCLKENTIKAITSYFESIYTSELFINRNGNKLTDQSARNFMVKIKHEINLTIKYKDLTDSYIEQEYLSFVSSLSSRVGLSSKTIMEKLTLYNKNQ